VIWRAIQSAVEIDQRSPCDKITVAHSITPSAMASNDGGTVSPSILAV